MPSRLSDSIREKTEPRSSSQPRVSFRPETDASTTCTAARHPGRSERGRAPCPARNYAHARALDGRPETRWRGRWVGLGRSPHSLGDSGSSCCDVNDDQIVDAADLSILLTNWGDLQLLDSSGWLMLPELVAHDSRIAFVAEDGHDGEASLNPHGRAYYLPGDPEIGSDSTRSIGPIESYRTIAAAKAALRDASGSSPIGEPD